MTAEQFTDAAQRYLDTVFRVAFNYINSYSDAEDVTQNVFLKLLKETGTFENQEHLKHWLIRVTVNECKNLVRSRWWKTESIDDYANTLTFDNPAHSELYHAVMALPVKFRMPIYLHYYEGYTTAEIGRLLRIPKNTVCSHLKRGRELLKEKLQEAKDDD